MLNKKGILKQLIIATILSITLGCASPETSPGDPDARRLDCIYQPSIRGYTVLDESNLIVSTSGRRQYHVALQRRAFGLRSSWAIGFKSPTGRICAAFSEVVFDGHLDGDRIRIASIREIDDEQEEELLIRFGRKKPEIEHTPAPQDIEGAGVEELDPAASDDSSGD